MATNMLSPASKSLPYTFPAVSETTSTYPDLLPAADANYFDTAPGSNLGALGKTITAMFELKSENLKTSIPLLVLVSYQEGFYVIEHQELGVFGRGETTADAVADFGESLIANYRAYAEERDENMDKFAQELARNYRRIFGKE